MALVTNSFLFSTCKALAPSSEALVTRSVCNARLVALENAEAKAILEMKRFGPSVVRIVASCY